jgi:hypothetical protein
MRKIYNPLTGSDVTASVQSTLQNGQPLVAAYLYRIFFSIFWNYNPYGAWGSYTFTDAAFPIFVNYQQIDAGAAQAIGHYLHGSLQGTGLNFYPEAITHDKLSYGIGFEDKPVTLDWAIDDTKTYNVVEEDAITGIFNTSIGELVSPVNCTVKQGMALGWFTDCPVFIHVALFSDFPDRGGTFLGTSLMFRGYIRKVIATRSRLKVVLSSLMDVFQSTQIPTQTITPNSRQLPYVPTAVSPYGLDWTTPVVITERVLQFNTAEVIAANALQDSWIVFYPNTFTSSIIYSNGMPVPPGFRIQGNDAATGTTVTVYFYEPFAMSNNILPTVFTQLVAGSGGANPGFLYLPPPEMSA